jgi:radical SAM protein with 4Fe4S-binding SPASM domain
VRFGASGSPTRELRYVPLSALRSTPTLPGVRTVATIQDEADADALEQLLRRFHEHGLIDLPSASAPVIFENTCRWIGAGGCGLNLLRRLAVDSDGTLWACRDAGAVGRAGEAFDQISTRVRRAQQLEEGRRACSSCPVRDDCSKCTNLPDVWAGRYCELRRKNPQTRLFFELQEVPHLGFGHLPAGDWLSFRVSYTDLPRCYYPGPGAGPRAGRRPVLLSIGDQNLAWIRGERKLTRIAAPLALMAEAWWNGAADAAVLEALVEKFKVDRGVAASGLERGLAQLNAGGLIHV